MTPDEKPPETVEGLDPRKLFARASERFDVSVLLRAWEPPPVEEVAPLFPPYEVLALIGRGGMGAVYRARQRDLDREVAIKLMPAEAAADDAFAARFRVEARALARLQHPNIVSIHESGQTREGHLFFVMEYVDGTDLAQLIESGRLRGEQALEILSRVCDALHYAHGQGIVHRDVKPGNVLIARSGAVKVADFGLAKLLPAAAPARSRHTMTGTVIGTPDYMAPEQLEGQNVDQRADIYSLGVMLYEMLTGQLPRGAWEPPSRTAKSDARLDEVVNKAMQRQPERRYQQASEVRTRVDQIRTSPARRAVPMRWLVVAAVVVIGGVAGWQMLTHRAPERSATSVQDHAPAVVPATPLVEPRTSSPPPRLAQDDKAGDFASLDLRTAIVAGDWRWKDDRAGDTLVHAPVVPDLARRVRLPFRTEGGGYKLTFHLTLLTSQADAGVVLPVGDARVGLAIDLNGSTGLGLVNLQRWDQNETSIHEALPVGQSIAFVVKVGPYYDGATIMVEADRRTLIRWQGKRRDLTLFEDPKRGWALPDAGDLGFVTYGGGVEISDVKFERFPPTR